METILKSNKDLKEKNFNRDTNQNQMILDIPQQAALRLSADMSNSQIQKFLTRGRIIYNSENTAVVSVFWIMVKNCLLFVSGFNLIQIYLNNFNNIESFRTRFDNLVFVLNIIIVVFNLTFVVLIIALHWLKIGIFDGSLDGYQGIKIGNFNLQTDYGFNSKNYNMGNKEFEKLKIINERTIRTLDLGDNSKQLMTLEGINGFFSTSQFVSLLNIFFNINQYLILPLIFIKIDFLGRTENLKIIENTLVQISEGQFSQPERLLVLCNFGLTILITLTKKILLTLNFINLNDKLHVFSPNFELIVYVLEISSLVLLKLYNYPTNGEKIMLQILASGLALTVAGLRIMRASFIFEEIQLLEIFFKVSFAMTVLFKNFILPPIFYQLGPDFVKYNQSDFEKIIELLNQKDIKFFSQDKLFLVRWRILAVFLMMGILIHLAVKNYTISYYDFTNVSYRQALGLKESILKKTQFSFKLINMLIFSLEHNGANFNFPNFFRLKNSKQEKRGNLFIRGLVEEHKTTCLYLNCCCKEILIDPYLHSMRSDKNLKIINEGLQKTFAVLRNMIQAIAENSHFKNDFLYFYCYFLTNFQNRPLQSRKIIEFCLLGEENFEKFYFKYFQHQQFKKKINKGRGFFNKTPPLNLLKYDLCSENQKLAVKKIFQFTRLRELLKLNLTIFLKTREHIYKELMLSEINLKSVMQNSIKAAVLEKFTENLFKIFEELTENQMPNFLIYQCFYEIRVKYNHFMKEALIKNLRNRLKMYFKDRQNIPKSLFKSYLESKTCVVTTSYSPISNSFSRIVYTTKNTDLVIGHPSKYLINGEISKFLPNSIKDIHNQFLRTSLAFKQKSVHCKPAPAYVNNQKKELLKVTMHLIFFCDVSKDSKIKIFCFITRKKLNDDSYLIMMDKSGYIRGASKAAIEFFGLDSKVISKGKLGINYLANEFDLLVSGLNWRILLGLEAEKNFSIAEKKEERELQEILKNKNGTTSSYKDLSFARTLPLFFEKQDISLMNKMRPFFDSLLDRAGRNMYIEYRDPNRKVLKNLDLLKNFSPSPEIKSKRKKGSFMKKFAKGKFDLTELFDDKDLEIVEGLFKMEVIEMILPTFTILRVIELKKISKSLSQYKEIIEKMKKGNLTMADQMKYGLNGDEGMIDPQKNFIISVDKSICMMKRRNKKTPKELKYIQTDLIEGETRFKHCKYCTDHRVSEDVEISNKFWEQLKIASKAFQKCLFSSVQARELAFQRISSLRKLSMAERKVTQDFTHHTIISTQSRSNKLLMSNSRAGSLHFKVGLVNPPSHHWENNLKGRKFHKKKEGYNNRISALSKKLYEMYRGKFKGKKIFNSFFLVMFFSLFFFSVVCIYDQRYLSESGESFDRGLKLDLSIKKVESTLIEFSGLNQILNIELVALKQGGGNEKNSASIEELIEIIEFLGVSFIRDLENFEIDYISLKEYQKLAAIDIDLAGLSILDQNFKYQHLVEDVKNSQKSNLFRLDQKIRTTILNQQNSINELKKYEKKESDSNLKLLENSTITLSSLTKSTYSPFFKLLSKEIYEILSDHVESLKNYFLFSSLLKFVFFLIPYLVVSIIIISYQKNLSSTFRKIRYIEQKDLKKLVELNQSCSKYCENIDKGFSTEPPKKQLEMKIEEESEHKHESNHEIIQQRKKSIFSKMNKKSPRLPSKEKNQGKNLVKLKQTEMKKSRKESINIPEHLKLGALEDKSSYQKSQKNLQIENFGGINLEFKKEKEGDEFFNQIIKGIFKSSSNHLTSGSNLSKGIQRRSIRPSKNISYKEKNQKGRILISQVKNNGKEDFGRKTYFLYMSLMVFFTSIPLVIFYSVSSEAISVMKAVEFIGDNCGSLRVNSQGMLSAEVDIFFGQMLGFEKYFSDLNENYKDYFGHEENNVEVFLTKLEIVDKLLSMTKRKIEIQKNLATKKFGFTSFFVNLLGIYNPSFDISKNYFFGRENICQKFEKNSENLVMVEYELLNSEETILEKEKEIMEKFKTKSNFFQKIEENSDFINLCKNAYNENFDKSWLHFESNLKASGLLSANTVMNHNGNVKEFYKFYKRVHLFDKTLHFSLFVIPILQLEHEILQLKNYETHFLLNQIHETNSIAWFLILVTIQIFLFNFVKNSLKKRFKVHQMFLSFFDLEVLMRKKILKQYIDFYDQNVGRELYDVFWLG